MTVADDVVWSVDTTADRLLDQVARRSEHPVEPITTGWRMLDSTLDGGLRPEDLVVVGGKPGVGKTVALLQWARTAAESCRPVAYVSFEHAAPSLLRRLLVSEIATLAAGRIDASKAVRLRRAIREHMDGQLELGELRAIDSIVDEAYERLRTDGPFLSLERGSSVSTDLDMIASLAGSKLGPGGVLIIDYLQKVPLGRTDGTDDDHAVETAARLKELAMSQHVVVVAASAASDDGITSRRLSLAGLRGSSALAHEADVALLMNEKAEVVSRLHGAYDLTLMERYSQQTVVTVEKNRDGPAPVHLQFTKDFANYRFDPEGSYVAERLVGDGMVEE